MTATPPEASRPPSLPQPIMTVRGPIPAESLGITMTHEHVFCDLSCWRSPPNTLLEKEVAGAPIRMEILGEVRRDALVFAQNLSLVDEDAAREELADLVAMGGNAIVDCTVKGLEPNLSSLLRVAEQVDLHVIAGCGYYVYDSHPGSLETATADDLASELIETIRGGFDGGGVRPGVIGEIGTGDPVHVQEWRVLEAACAANLETGLPIYVHVYPMADGKTAPEIAKFVLDRGVAPTKLNICHMDVGFPAEQLRRVLELGAFISFDTFGMEAYYDSIDWRIAFDAERERLLLQMLDEGYAAQLLLSQDVCMKMQLRRYGGQGYSHILRHVVPSLRRRGVDEATIDTLLRDNPRRLLSA